jgi:RNA polymerase sigma-70 factor (ECF subfamily)
VLAAADSGSPKAPLALETLCRTYWYPLYAYVRGRGYGPEDAQDLTQEFFMRLLSKQALGAVHQELGRFRSFLIASLNHFLANEWDKAHAQKRGGNTISIPLETAETRYGAEVTVGMSADRIFERQWGLALLAQVRTHLREDYEAAGNGSLFSRLQIYLAGERGLTPYSETASQLGLSIDAVKKAVERLRRRFGELLREEIAHTVADPTEIEEEIRYLRRVLAPG